MLKLILVMVLIYLELHQLTSQTGIQVDSSNLRETQTAFNEYSYKNSGEYQTTSSDDTESRLMYILSTSTDCIDISSSETLLNFTDIQTTLTLYAPTHSGETQYTSFTSSQIHATSNIYFTSISSQTQTEPHIYITSSLIHSQTSSNSCITSTLSHSETLSNTHITSKISQSQTWSDTYTTSNISPSQTSSHMYTTSALSQPHNLSDMYTTSASSQPHTLSTLNQAHTSLDTYIPSTLKSSQTSSDTYIRSSLNSSHTSLDSYIPLNLNASQASSETLLTLSQSQTTHYQTTLSNVLLNSIFANLSTSTQQATTNALPSRGENIILIAILSSVAVFLVISFAVLTCCLLYRRRNDTSDTPTSDVPGHVSSHPRRHFHFSYLPNPLFRRFSTDSTQHLQTMGRPEEGNAISSVRRTPSKNNAIDSSSSETKFNGNNENLLKHQRRAKQNTNTNFGLRRNSKNDIPSLQRLAVVNEEVNDEDPIYAVVKKNASKQMNMKNSQSNSSKLTDGEIGNGTIDAKVQDLDNHQNPSRIYTQLPYSDIVLQNSNIY